MSRIKTWHHSFPPYISLFTICRSLVGKKDKDYGPIEVAEASKDNVPFYKCFGPSEYVTKHIKDQAILIINHVDQFLIVIINIMRSFRNV